MNATDRDLRTHAKKLLEAVDRGEEVLITHRGKPRARLVPLAATETEGSEVPALFGLWRDHEEVEDVGRLTPSINARASELVLGMRNKRELRVLRDSIRRWQATLFYLDEEISTRAAAYVGGHFLSQSLTLADALIGATAVTHRLTLLTADDRPYRVIAELNFEKFRP